MQKREFKDAMIEMSDNVSRRIRDYSDEIIGKHVQEQIVLFHVELGHLLLLKEVFLFLHIITSFDRRTVFHHVEHVLLRESIICIHVKDFERELFKLIFILVEKVF